VLGSFALALDVAPLGSCTDASCRCVPSDIQADSYFTAADCCHGAFESAEKPCVCDDGWVGNACEFRGQAQTSAVTVGPTHFQTLDDAFYDFFGVGDFVLLRVPSAGVEVRLRQEKCFGNITACMSAVSLGFGGVHVSVFREETAHKVVANGDMVSEQMGAVVVGGSPSRRLGDSDAGLLPGELQVEQTAAETTVITLSNGIVLTVTCT